MTGGQDDRDELLDTVDTTIAGTTGVVGENKNQLRRAHIGVQGGAFSSARVPLFFEARVTQNASAGRPKTIQGYSTPW